MYKNIFYLTIFIFFISVRVQAQVHVVFLDDTLFHYTPPRGGFKFIDSLADGTWILHNLYRKDSVKAGEQTIMLTGTYKDYKKEGTFNYYSYCYPLGSGNKSKNKKPYKQHYVEKSETYKSGLLNGMKIVKNWNNVTAWETMYENGKKNGLDVHYTSCGQNTTFLSTISYFSHDTLIDRAYYAKNTLFWTIKRLENGEYIETIYDTIGQKRYVKYYDANYAMYKWQKYYPNQSMEREVEGYFYMASIRDEVFEFHYSNRRFCEPLPLDWYEYDFSLFMVKGTERLYNHDGILTEEKEVVNKLKEEEEFSFYGTPEEKRVPFPPPIIIEEINLYELNTDSIRNILSGFLYNQGDLDVINNGVILYDALMDTLVQYDSTVFFEKAERIFRLFTGQGYPYSHFLLTDKEKGYIINMKNPLNTILNNISSIPAFSSKFIIRSMFVIEQTHHNNWKNCLDMLPKYTGGNAVQVGPYYGGVWCK